MFLWRIASLTSDSLKAREIVYSRHKNVISHHPSFPSSSYLVVFSGCNQILEGGLFTQLCHLNSVLQNTKTGVSLLPVSRCLSLWWYQQFYFFWLHNNQHFTVHKNCIWSFLFSLQVELRTPVRRCSVDTELSCRMNRLKQEFRVRGFSIEVNGTFVLSSFENSSILSTDVCENRVSLTILSFCVRSHCCSWEPPYHVVSEPGPRNVQCPGRNCFA